MEPRLPHSPSTGFDQLLGLELLELTAELARGRLLVREQLKQPAGLVHGGVYAALAESLASIATAVAVSEDDLAAMGLSNQTSFLRPITEGAIHGLARRRHRGRSTWVWEVEATDDQDRLCALTLMTVAVRPMPAHPPGAP
jgi:1,4-dihydroxy-2-naphthoyl-CoA hydrolase